MTNDIKVLNGLVAISPNITIWSGKRKMQAEDFGINKNELPPAEISDLGAKKLCPPEKMRIFLSLKARCVTLLDRHGIKFIASSWLVPKDKVNGKTRKSLVFMKDIGEGKKGPHRHSRWFPICACKAFLPAAP